MGDIYIYSLSDPITNDIRYIGQTKQKLNRRLNKHILESNNDVKKTHNHSWIKSILKRDLKPNIELIDSVNENNWVFWEQHYISLFKSWGYNLNNHTIGGEGRIGIAPWNKGTKGVCKANSGSFKKGSDVGKETRIKEGERLSINTEFKKGNKPWNSGKKHSKKAIKKMREIKLGKISGNRKLTFDVAEEIRVLRKEGCKILDLCNKYSVSKTTIKGIIYNKHYLK